MKIRKYRMDQLEEARKIQKDCIKHHIPCPPVAWWQAQIMDSKGEIEEQIESKCNSYTRNGLNLIATNALYPSPNVISKTVFGDGVLSYKKLTGALNTSTYFCGFYSYSQNYSPTDILVGKGSDPEYVDAHTLSNDITSTLSCGTTSRSTVFNSETRKMCTILQRTFGNGTINSIILTEAGISTNIRAIGDATSEGSCLVVRDVFESTIEIPAGKSLVFTYNFELLYPE